MTMRGEQSKAKINQLTTVSKDRLRDFAGRVSPMEMASIERAILFQLALK